VLQDPNVHTAIMVLIVVAVANRTSVGRQILGASGATWF